MIVSFFQNGVALFGVDYSDNPNLVYQEDIDFNVHTQVATLEGDEGNYSIRIEDLPPTKENEQEKFARVFQKLIQAERLEIDKKDELLEGVEFSNKQIGDLIQARVFEDNPHAESAMQAKFSAWIASVVLGNPNTELKAEIDVKQAKINEVREFFNILPLIF